MSSTRMPRIAARVARGGRSAGVSMSLRVAPVGIQGVPGRSGDHRGREGLGQRAQAAFARGQEGLGRTDAHGSTKRGRQRPGTIAVTQDDDIDRRVRHEAVDEQSQHRGHESGHVATDDDHPLDVRAQAPQTRTEPRERPFESPVVVDEACPVRQGRIPVGRRHDDDIDTRSHPLDRLDRVVEERPPVDRFGELVAPEPRRTPAGEDDGPETTLA